MGATAGIKMLQKCDWVPYPGLREYWVTLALGGWVAILGAYSGPLGSDWLAEGWEGVSSICPALINTSHVWPREKGILDFAAVSVAAVKVPFLFNYHSQKSHICAVRLLALWLM